MHFLPLVTLLSSTLSTAIAASCSNCSPTSPDGKVLQYAWAIQVFSYAFYETNAINKTDFSSALNNSAANYSSNLEGIKRQNLLGAAQVETLGSNISDFQQPKCNFSIPTPSNASTYVFQAWYWENTLAGAFIGLAKFTQTPIVSQLLSWLSVQHATHATYIASFNVPTVFEANGSSTIPILPPDRVLSTEKDDLMLGNILDGCVVAPNPPCS
ncbi:hypothetical protein BJX68DRAFT_168176 [Aspergillus pseudodeflectus]|uniref:Uncharacterized protein n=1 Tax=Aspergillus pseudodeflectus TaxID=176178 RepID=A0ABR4JPU8_9EURO